MRPLSVNIQRILGVLGLGVAFVVMASIFSPDRSQAEYNTPHAPRNAHSVSSQPAPAKSQSALNAGHMALGTFETSRYIVEIWSGTVEPLYTIKDARTSETLATLLAAEEVAERFPDLDLASIDNSAGQSSDQQIMIAKPEMSPADWDAR